MIRINLSLVTLFFAFITLSVSSCKKADEMGVNYQTADIDMAQFKKLIEDLNSSFSKDFKNFDSIALGNYYASDGSMGSVKGKDKLVSAWGKNDKKCCTTGHS